MVTKGISNEMLGAVQEYVQQRIQTAGSQNEAARQMGISGAHIINFREGHWDKISQRQFNTIAHLAGINSWRDVKTANLSIATGLLAQAQSRSRMLALSGYTGAGKTHAMRLYARKTPQAYYVLADAEMNKRRFLNAILQAIGVRPDDAGNNIGEALDAIARKLNREDSPLLMIDDAGKLTDSLLRIIQIIYDRTEGRAGIVLAGTEYLKESIEAKARRNVMGFRELKRRVAYWEEMSSISKVDVRGICEANGITDASAIAYLASNVSDFGTLREMVLNALDMADGGEVTREVLAALYAGREWYNPQWK
jgi:DNA transposition AAA+ family ATPase